jgi:hypothetical protein
VYLAEIIVHEVQSDRVSVVFGLFAESVRQPSEPAQVHPHRQVLPFNMAGADTRFFWVA